MKVKMLAREEWPRILERSQAFMPLEFPELNGFAALIRIKKITEPLSVKPFGTSLVIADEGYDWLQIAPEDANWWLTVMYDAEGKPIQYYFDVSLDNKIDADQSRFTDLFLDVVLLPDGRIELLDEEELNEALASGLISPDEHAMAVRTAQMLIQKLPGESGRLAEFCREVRRRLMSRSELAGNV